MTIDWTGLTIAIPLIVLVVTLIFSLRKEKRDRDYQYRPVPSILGVTSRIRESSDSSKFFILYNDEVMDVDKEERGNFLELTNIASSPMLNVLIDVEYEASVKSQKYQILSIQQGESFIIPVSRLHLVDEKETPLWKRKKITITFRSLSGQKHRAVSLPDGQITIKAKNNGFYTQTIVSTENDRNSHFVEV
ncbi:hypothetical protein [Planomicrobium okeanokoites]|uniref:hypothetical protein n=1 Tax=Planomicrobium okeanokoites TaxID=244 RepID=UPI0009FDE483|nr:hypothetical protein [Planomicrobium okeanokoites]